MLAIRPTELHHHVEYMLDTSIECNGIDAGARMILVLYGDKERVEEYFASGSARWHHWQSEIYPQVMGYATELFGQLDAVRQVGAILLGLSTLRQNVTTHAEWMAQTAIVDACEGGALKDWFYCQPPKWDIAPPKRRARRLHSPRAIRQYIRHMPETGQMRALHKSIKARIKLLDTANVTVELFREADSIFDQDMAEQRERREARHMAGYARMFTEERLKQSPKSLKERRKKLVRAATTATTVLGPAVVNRFIAGQPVDLAGQAVILTVQRRSDIGHIGHGGLHLRLRDLNRAPLAALCLYIDGTPVLDQLTAFALAMQTGEEAELLSQANIVSATEAGAAHPLLQERVKGRAERAEERDANSPCDRRDRRNRDYWQRTKGIWVNTLGRHVFGREWRTLWGTHELA